MTVSGWFRPASNPAGRKPARRFSSLCNWKAEFVPPGETAERIPAPFAPPSLFFGVSRTLQNYPSNLENLSVGAPQTGQFSGGVSPLCTYPQTSQTHSILLPLNLPSERYLQSRTNNNFPTLPPAPPSRVHNGYALRPLIAP